jgi:hypothetical protein
MWYSLGPENKLEYEMAFGKHPAVVDADHYGQLKCKCGSEYLHQGNITVFERGEDGDTTTVIAQDGKTVQTSNFPDRDTCNPSPRRHGLIIEFDCEECGVSNGIPGGTLQRLAIFQHKGNTFMEWVD